MATSKFGSIRKLPSGKFQASYPNPNGKGRINAPETFTRRADANAWLARVQSDKIQGILGAPQKVEPITFAEYATAWLGRLTKRASTIRVYGWAVEAHLLPTFGSTYLHAITSAQVKDWFDSLHGVIAPSSRALAYTVLYSIMKSAVEAEKIPVNPCKVKGGTKIPPPAEEMVLTEDEVATLVSLAKPHYQAMLLVALYAHLRHAELIGLRRRDVYIEAGAVRIDWQLLREEGQWVRQPPKSDKSRRTIHLPPAVVDALAAHLAEYVEDDPEALVFTTTRGKPMHRSAYNLMLKILGEKIGRPDLHSHLLRHTGLTIVAQNGATMQELMGRAGHSDVKTALRYQHASLERDRALAERMNSGVVILPPDAVQTDRGAPRWRAVVNLVNELAVGEEVSRTTLLKAVGQSYRWRIPAVVERANKELAQQGKQLVLVTGQGRSRYRIAPEDDAGRAATGS